MPTVYKPAGREIYKTDIWIDGRKFSRSTGETSQRAAQIEAVKIEAKLREEVAAGVKAEESLTLDHVAGRYMRDVGNHHAGEGASITAIKIAFLIFFFGPDKPMDKITDQDVFNLLNWRRAHHVGEWRRDKKGKWVHRKPAPNAKLISPFTVNDTVEQLKKLFTYVKNTGVKLPRPPNFGNPKFWLSEPKARPRAFSDKERAGLNEALNTREDAEPIVLFSRMSGKRKRECVTLEWDHVKWDRDVIERRGKGDALVTIKITPAICVLLKSLEGHHPKYVFTYVAQRTNKVKRKDGTEELLIKGKRYPYTTSGLRRTWTTRRKRGGIPIAGPDRVRWHDIRHDFAINFLRANPTAHDMKALQQAMDHADFQTTADTYAAVLNTEVEEQIEAQAQKLLRERLAYKNK